MRRRCRCVYFFCATRRQQPPTITTMLASSARQASRRVGTRSVYVPTLVERREGEAGTGGRSSEAAKKVAVFGASGFLGGYLCAELGANGYMAYLANRGDDMEMRHLKPNFDLGRTRFVFYSPRDRESIQEVIADADVVVNLIGKYYESGQPVQTDKFPFVSYRTNYSFEEANVTIPQTLAEICKEMQVDHFIHVSSASASPDATSEWSRTKYLGEQAIKEVYPWATIVRPTQMFGRQDRILNWFAKVSKIHRMVPLVDGGKALTQPVFVQDVAKTLLRLVDDSASFEGKQVDCFGPAEFSYKELAQLVDDITERRRPMVHVPHYYLRLAAQALQYQRDPLFTPDLVDIWSQDFLPTLAAEAYAEQDAILTMADLGVQATPMEKVVFEYMQMYRHGGHFFRVQGYH